MWNSAGTNIPEFVNHGTNIYVDGPSATPIDQINISTGATYYLLGDAALLAMTPMATSPRSSTQTARP